MKFTLRQARDYAGLTQKEMAKRLHIAQITYGMYERGEREMRVNTAKRFSEIVGIDLNDLIFYGHKVYVS